MVKFHKKEIKKQNRALYKILSLKIFGLEKSEIDNIMNMVMYNESYGLSDNEILSNDYYTNIKKK